MNEKGWWWLRAGWLVRGFKDRGCHRQKTLRAPLFSRICRASFLFFFTFSLARISADAVSKLFLCLAVKDHTVCVYIYARVYRESTASREGAVACLVPWNYAILRISQIWEPFRDGSLPAGKTLLARRDTIFFVICVTILILCVYLNGYIHH